MKTIDKITFDDTGAIRDKILSKKLGIPVVHAKSFHKLNQIVGYAKYTNGTDGNIFFRGQSEIYSNCLPSLLRRVKSEGRFQERGRKLKKFLKTIDAQIPVISTLDDVFIEPLMQHYGINTRWVDLVDNIWVALWFGLHEYRSVQNRQANNQTNPYIRDYVHVARRKDGDLYILLIYSDANQIRKPGYYLGKETKLVDLRIGCPSIFLRPHAQHGLLATSRGANLKDYDFYKWTVGIVRISVSDALEWLGDGNLLTHANMYPSPVFDYGYHFFLDSLAVQKDDREILGTIKVYTSS